MLFAFGALLTAGSLVLLHREIKIRDAEIVRLQSNQKEEETSAPVQRWATVPPRQVEEKKYFTVPAQPQRRRNLK